MTTAKKKVNVQQLVLCGIFTALIAIGAFIRIPVPLIPFTLQLFFVTMAGFYWAQEVARLVLGFIWSWG